jgi:hypothetical protein
MVCTAHTAQYGFLLPSPYLPQVMFQYFPDSTSLQPALEGLQVEMLPAPPLEQAKVCGMGVSVAPELAAVTAVHV